MRESPAFLIMKTTDPFVRALRKVFGKAASVLGCDLADRGGGIVSSTMPMPTRSPDGPRAFFQDGFDGHRRRSLAMIARMEKGERLEAEKVIIIADPVGMLACLSE